MSKSDSCTTIFATEIIMRYRQALNYLWNMHFFAQPEFRPYEYLAAEEFIKCQLPLFNSLVLDRLPDSLSGSREATAVFGVDFKIVPRQPSNKIATIMVNKPPTGTFDIVRGNFKAEELKMYVVDFFDFQVRGWREFRFYLAEIEECLSNAAFVGRQALVEVENVDVIWSPAETIDGHQSSFSV